MLTKGIRNWDQTRFGPNWLGTTVQKNQGFRHANVLLSELADALDTAAKARGQIQAGRDNLRFAHYD